MTTDTGLTCDGCGFDVRIKGCTGDHAPHREVATAFGWQMGQPAIGEEGEQLCPVCVEKARTYVSPLVVPGKHKYKPVPRHKLFQQPAGTLQPVASPRDPRKRLVALCRELIEVFATHFNTPDGVQWHEHEGSTWQVGIVRRDLKKAEVQG